MTNLVTIKRGNGEIQYDTDLTWYLKTGTEILLEGGQKQTFLGPGPVHPTVWGYSMEGEIVFNSLIYYSKTHEALCSVQGVTPNTQDDSWTDAFLVKATNIITSVMKVAQIYDMDYEIPYVLEDMELLIIRFDDTIKDECLLSYDYLSENLEEFPLLQELHNEMTIKGIAYLWL